MARTRRDDQVIVRVFPWLVVDVDDPLRGVYGFDLTENHLGVLLFAENVPDRCSNVGRRELRGTDLDRVGTGGGWSCR